jgi:phosphoribosylamine--glycine ligase
MIVMVVGGGAREHALAWSLRRSAGVSQVIAVPGNAGIARDALCLPCDVTDVRGLAALARARRVDLTVVGPEAALAAGIADEFASQGLAVFGATRAAAEIETSKVFAKEFMVRHGIPTAPFAVASGADEAGRILKRRGDRPVVIKADGLAAGKGVVVAAGRRQAQQAIEAMLVERRFGAAGDRVLIEDRLRGPEVSVFALCDGERARLLTTCQDYKRLRRRDRGPNTGGMGGYSPSVLVDRSLERRVFDDIVTPTVKGLAAEGRPYRGVLYAGLMLTSKGPMVLEYNARFGDPEAQLIAIRLASDLLPALQATLAGRLEEAPIRFHPGGAVCVVLAAAGYPGPPRSGDRIAGLDETGAWPGSSEVQVFHAASRRDADGRFTTAGGRVLTVTARGAGFAAARRLCYAAVRSLRFRGRQFRTDIAAVAVRRGTPGPEKSKAAPRHPGRGSIRAKARPSTP